MSREEMTEQQVAAYLHMDLREVQKLASRGQIPCRKVGGQFRFYKGQLDHWVEAQMSSLGKERLAGIEKGVSAHHGFEENTPIICSLIATGGVAAPLEGRTRDGVIRALVDKADAAGLVYAKPELIDEIRQREELCSTAIVPGVALPHPRHPLPYDIASSFITVGLVPGGVPYGAPDGALTRLFFLICCKDDRTHLHVLARLAQMLHEQHVIDELLAAKTAGELAAMLEMREAAITQSRLAKEQ